MGRKNKEFWQSAFRNNATFQQYYNRLTELSISMFEWVNLPPEIDPRYLELTLFSRGMVVFFQDSELKSDDMGGYVALQATVNGQFNLYGIPNKRHVYSVNGYNNNVDETNSVIIYNNLLHTDSRLDVQMFAERLYNLDRAIDVNANAQKTPILIRCLETQRLSLSNLYKEYDGNAPVIMGDKGLDPNAFSVLKTDAPYVADKLYTLKTQIWNEALTYLGISNISVTKKERLITDEVERNQGGTIASRYSRLEARRQACRQINEMFGLDIDCKFRDDFDEPNSGEDSDDSEGGEEDE